MQKKQGFSLIEVILAIFILTVAVFGSFALIQQTSNFAAINQTKLTAYYLCQEGIEKLRNNRDTAWLQGGNWESWLNSLSLLPEEISLAGKTFTRTTNVSSDGNRVLVTVTVKWSERGREHSVSAMTYLYNWCDWCESYETGE